MRTFSITDVGMVRQVNQDYVFTTDKPLGILRNLFVVADGMGGHQAGDYASKYTVEVLQRELKNSEGEDVEKVLVGAIKTANKEIIKEASRDVHLKGMGTTVVAATIVNQMMYFANVGDSRLYLINQGIQQLTKDHSLVEEMVRLGGIKPEEAKHHPDKNIITRAIGAKADVDVDFYEHRLKKGDIILIFNEEEKDFDMCVSLGFFQGEEAFRKYLFVFFEGDLYANIDEDIYVSYDQEVPDFSGRIEI